MHEKQGCNLRATLALFMSEVAIASRKIAAGAERDCSRPLEWRKRLLRKETRETRSPLTPLLMPSRQETLVKYCLVFCLSKEGGLQSESYCFLWHMPCLFIHHDYVQWKPHILSAQTFPNKTCIPENWRGLCSCFCHLWFQFQYQYCFLENSFGTICWEYGVCICVWTDTC